MKNNCENCEEFIPKSKNKPFNAFDYIAGNIVGVCNFPENVDPLSKIINNCKNWKQRKLISEIIFKSGIPYCGKCSKMIEDYSHDNCVWCGNKLNWID